MRLKAIFAGLAAMTALGAEASAATLDYQCFSYQAARGLDDARQRGQDALFAYRLNRAVANGECSINGGGSVQAKASSASEVAQEKLAPEAVRARLAMGTNERYARVNRFPPPWLFRPVR